ncbi:surface lipoprotein assembly modifier [Basilea psittacipulmonis]|uniref:DUF560 domain-containing protein n=1 Tax=Basilea psittacipulmonis DSM 24701 TaxID=1072685 RepID=A0A077DBY1_9BURK|nr:surface lipoprotein assembly modifier [Basilea psittacipulmonis]AIL32164.1 hypothetical protein IX83_01460 [Basilea psittacipulmonis DSM 24701]
MTNKILFTCFSIFAFQSTVANILYTPNIAQEVKDHFDAYQQNEQWLKQRSSGPTAIGPTISDSQTLSLSSQELLQHSELLEKAFIIALNTFQIGGIEKLLPLYRQLPQANSHLIHYAQGLLAFKNQEASSSAQYFKKILDEHPNAVVADYFYALSSFKNKHYDEANTRFKALLNTNIPETKKQDIIPFHQFIQNYQKWDVSLMVSPFYDQNINNAPDQRHWNGFTFAEKIADYGMRYYLSVSKKILLPKGWVVAPSVASYGKIFKNEKTFNDVNLKTFVNIIQQSQYQDFLIQPYFHKRWFGNQAYSQSKGLTLGWGQDWSSILSTQVNVAYEREKFHGRTFLNNYKQMADGVIFLSPSDTHTFIFQQGFVHQYATRDQDDRYISLRSSIAWIHTFSHGLNTRIGVFYESTRYKGPTLLTGQENRKDKAYGWSLDVKHASIQYKGIQPSLGFRYSKHRSNSALHRYTKKDVVFSIQKSF